MTSEDKRSTHPDATSSKTPRRGYCITRVERDTAFREFQSCLCFVLLVGSDMRENCGPAIIDGVRFTFGA